MLVVLYMFFYKKALVKGAENEKIQRAKTKSKALAKRGKKILAKMPTMPCLIHNIQSDKLCVAQP